MNTFCRTVSEKLHSRSVTYKDLYYVPPSGVGGQKTADYIPLKKIIYHKNDSNINMDSTVAGSMNGRSYNQW